MVSFQYKLAEGFLSQGIEVTYDLDEGLYAAVLVIGGTRQVEGLWRARRGGVRIVQRLDGMNWLHRVRHPGLRHFLRAEYGNFLLSSIRSHLAQRVVYQSLFSLKWWERVYGLTRVPHEVIYNGIDLQQYSPEGPNNRPIGCCRLLLVEGSLMGGYEMGLETAVQLGLQLGDFLGESVELTIAGRVSEQVKSSWRSRLKGDNRLELNWAGLVPRERIPELDRSAHLLYSSDINAACPNSVIEALACGLPVLAFNTGALPELVQEDAGKVVDYGGDPWNLDPPDTPALVQAAVALYTNQDLHRQAARQRAEAEFGLDKMVAAYRKVLLDD